MRYIGGKSILLESIYDEINSADHVKSVMDIFSGSGVVSRFLVEKGYDVLSNDFLYFSYVLTRGTIGISESPAFKGLDISNVIEYLNGIEINDTSFDIKDCFIYNNYAPNEQSNRMYFQPENAIKIDLIRMQIEEWKNLDAINEDEYYYLLAALIYAVPYISNITGTYGAYLKFWDKRTYNKLTLIKPEIKAGAGKAACFNLNYTDMLEKEVDLLYADPPYNAREYLPNYHILETIARYDKPQINGVTGIREYTKQKSDFCKKNKVEKAFEDLIKNANARYILISYNNEGLVSTEKLSEICKTYAVNDTFHLTEKDYRRYKNKIPNNTEGLKEQLYFLRRH